VAAPGAGCAGAALDGAGVAAGAVAGVVLGAGEDAGVDVSSPLAQAKASKTSAIMPSKTGIL
jgi:hypothetical protein